MELTEAIDKVLRGGSYVTPQAKRDRPTLRCETRKPESAVQSRPLRQREVIQLLAEGRSMKEAASILCVTKRTVAAHKYSAMAMLQLKSNAELVQYAIKNHIVSI